MIYSRGESTIPFGCLAAAVVLLTCSPSLSADKSSQGTAIYDQFPAPLRPALKRAYADELKRRTAIVAKTKSVVAKARGEESKAAALEQLEEAKSDLEELRENDPPFVGILRYISHVDNMARSHWALGDIGVDTQPDGLTVIQVIDGRSALLLQTIPGGGRQEIYIEGIDTTGWTDGNTYPINSAIWVSGTTTFKTTGGGSSTVLKAEAFDWERYKKSIDGTKK